MAVELLHKRNSSTGTVPSTSALALGEIAINTYDGKLFIKKDDGTQSIVTFDPNASSLAVQEVNSNNLAVSGSIVNNVDTLSFDEDAFVVTNLNNGDVKVSVDGFYKHLHVDSSLTPALTASGVDSLNLIAGNGVTITADANGSPNPTLTFSTPSKTVQLFQDGTLENTTGSVRWYAPGDITINDIAARISTTSNVNVQISVLKSGSSAESLTLNSGNSKVTKSTNFSMGTDDYLTVDIVCTNNTSGTGLSVEFFYTFD